MCRRKKIQAVKRLNADNWLGLLETSAFPNVEVEMKQIKSFSWWFKKLYSSIQGH